MDSAKKAEFVRVMGKKFLRLRKGGVVQHFDDGGTILGGPGSGATNTGSGFVQNISNALGTNAASANTQSGTNAAQLNKAYAGAQTGLESQAGVMNALAPQVGTAVNNQNELAGQERAMAAGQGPNPAQAQLAQATGANVANQAALMAGQRGASSNPALMARQAAMQGAATQQGAAGQAATLEANQQINAQNNLANLSNNQINQTGAATGAFNTAEQNEQNILQNANTAANGNAVAMQSNINNNNANTNTGLMGMAGKGLSAVTTGLFAKGGEIGPNHPGPHKLDFVHKMTKMALQHFDEGGSVQPPPPPPTSPMQESMRKAFHFDGGGSIPGIQAAPMQSWGGQYSQMAAPQQIQADLPALKPLDLGPPAPKKVDPMAQANAGLSEGQDKFNDMLAPSAGSGANQLSGEGVSGTNSMGQSAVLDYASGPHVYRGGNIHPGPHKSHVANYLADGGVASKVPAMVSPGEIYLSPEQVQKVIHEGANPLKIGQKFKGKAKVKGDSLKNDTIPMDLESGGVVIDRKNVMCPEKAELFVRRAMARKKAGGK